MSAAGSPPTPAPGAGRLMSLDVFRGATIAGMMLVNNPGSWGHIYGPLEHAEWHGWTYTDTIFPFFLWIVGVAIPLATARRLETGQGRFSLLGHAVRRAAILFGLGLGLELLRYFLYAEPSLLGVMGHVKPGAPTPVWGDWWHNLLTSIRIPGVLQRIAICYLGAMCLFLFLDRYRQVSVTIGLLAAYWLLMALAPYPMMVTGQLEFTSGKLEPGNNFSAYVDNAVLNGPVIGTHVYSENKTWDPEGIVSTLPAIASVMFGVFAGQLLRSKRSDAEKAAWLLVSGALLMWAGQWLEMGLPINKKIWTSSYAVFMAGLASVVFGVCYWLVDVQGWRRAAKPLAVYGMNAIAVFMLSGILGRFLAIKLIAPSGSEAVRGKWVGCKEWLHDVLFVGPWTWLHEHVFTGAWFSAKIPSLTWAILWVLMLYLVAWVMYRKKWFVRF